MCVTHIFIRVRVCIIIIIRVRRRRTSNLAKTLTFCSVCGRARDGARCTYTGTDRAGRVRERTDARGSRAVRRRGWKHGVTGLKTWLLRRTHCDKRKAAQWKTERFRCGLVDYKRFMETGSERYFG